MLAGMLMSIILAILGGGFYLATAPETKNPSYFGLAEVYEVSEDTETPSIVLVNNEKLPAEIITASKGDIVSIYSDSDLYTNNPTGHSSKPHSRDEVFLLFALITLVIGIAGFFLGYLGASFLQHR